MSLRCEWLRRVGGGEGVGGGLSRVAICDQVQVCETNC